ncbi:MAG TPA: agmatine deiminase family protein [Paludibacter sp.]|nr:agmatine deiminase family protein [Paludibacter sp.]
MTDKIQKILPPEWAEQQFVQLTWPHNETDWADMLDEVNQCFVNIAREIIKREDLLIVCNDAEVVECFFDEEELSKITFAEMPINDTWARDHGGITVFEDGKPVIYDFTFNGWGMKFAANHDNLITRKLYMAGIFGDAGHKNCFDFVLEGGSIESDGLGTVLTTAECLLSDNRNNLSEDEIEAKLKDLFGLKQVLWLNHGYLVGDDTDSHVDTLARFCDKSTIAYVTCDDTEDEHYYELKKMKKELRSFRTSAGGFYRLIPLPMADAVYDEEGERLPATYANFLIINGAVLVPTYSSPKDEIAKQQLQKAFPDREIVGIDCNALIKQHGSLHCVTMQYTSPQPPPKEGEWSKK